MKKILGFLIFLFISNSLADGHVIKAKQSMLYFAGLYPNYLLYLQGDIPKLKMVGLIKTIGLC